MRVRLWWKLNICQHPYICGAFFHHMETWLWLIIEMQRWKKIHHCRAWWDTITGRAWWDTRRNAHTRACILVQTTPEAVRVSSPPSSLPRGEGYCSNNRRDTDITMEEHSYKPDSLDSDLSGGLQIPRSYTTCSFAYFSLLVDNVKPLHKGSRLMTTEASSCKQQDGIIKVIYFLAQKKYLLFHRSS